MTHCEHCQECKAKAEAAAREHREYLRQREDDRRPMTREEHIAIGEYFEDARLIEKFRGYGEGGLAWEWSAPSCGGATAPELYGLLDCVGDPGDEI